MDKVSNQSEVARILSKIDAEISAAQRGLNGFTETTKHIFITARIENLGRLHEDLHAIVGNDAVKLLAERLESILAE